MPVRPSRVRGSGRSQGGMHAARSLARLGRAAPGHRRDDRRKSRSKRLRSARLRAAWSEWAIWISELIWAVGRGLLCERVARIARALPEPSRVLSSAASKGAGLYSTQPRRQASAPRTEPLPASLAPVRHARSSQPGAVSAARRAFPSPAVSGRRPRPILRGSLSLRVPGLARMVSTTGHPSELRRRAGAEESGGADGEILKGGSP